MKSELIHLAEDTLAVLNFLDNFALAGDENMKKQLKEAIRLLKGKCRAICVPKKRPVPGWNTPPLFENPREYTSTAD